MSVANREKTWFDKGDRIFYQYDHYLNRWSTTQIIKKGVFIRTVKRKKRYLAEWDANPWCIVELEGNKNPSRVRMSQLRHNREKVHDCVSPQSARQLQ